MFYFLYNVYCMVFVSCGIINIFMTCMHAYVNIWCCAKSGWRQFIEHRTAVNKIELLPDATTVQLSELNDVCAICCQNMNSAKITRCNHYFHGICLRKWLHNHVNK